MIRTVGFLYDAIPSGKERNASMMLSSLANRRKKFDLLMYHKILHGRCGLKPEDFCTTSLEFVREYIVEFDDEKICATFDVYAVLQSSELLAICVKLLSITRIVDKWPNVLQFMRYLLCDRYYGTLFIAHHPELTSLYAELKKLADNQKLDEVSSDVATFDEGVWEFDEKFPDAKEVHLTLAYRLHALHLVDEMRGCAGTLRHCIDDDQRVMALKSLCELCKEESGRGKREVVWILAQKYVYYIVDVIDHSTSSSGVRSSACFGLAVHLLSIVVAEVDDPKFWMKHAKMFCRLISKGYITPSDHRKVCEYLVPFSNPLFQRIGDNSSDVIVGFFKK
ncbi:hypothetical protein Y032_0189g1226 [Ancylostoma ceylanicum]|uniref:Uncharacterized protein n=1 Tax=Ancylostoma ceylanicum TaxID=53326 RepID=A0A016SRG3_9BILA|nr:hypothetical protein Y032_0189g1226 [Ancylostoma ceylanicum]